MRYIYKGEGTLFPSAQQSEGQLDSYKCLPFLPIMTATLRMNYRYRIVLSQPGGREIYWLVGTRSDGSSERCKFRQSG